MSATPPDANTEYSRAPGPSDLIADLLGWRRNRVHPGFSAGLRAGVLAVTLLGALLLVVAEFTTLFTVKLTATGQQVSTVATHSHNSFALIPIALLAVVLAWAATSTGNRWALVALLAVGIAALLIALVGDLPDAQASGTIGTVQSGFKNATAQASAGLYLETAGAIALMIAGGSGLLLGAPGTVRGPRADIKSGDDLSP